MFQCPPFNTIKDYHHIWQIKNLFNREQFQPNTLLAVKNQPMNKIGYICSGSIDLLSETENGRTIKRGHLEKGEYFGIENLLYEGSSFFSVITTDFVDCLTIEKQQLQILMEKHTVLKAHFENFLFEKLRQVICFPSIKNIAAAAQSGLHVDSLQKAVAYVDRHYTEPITLEKLSGIVGMSRFHFSRIFHQKTGLKFKAYLNSKRLETAKKLLTMPDINVSQACYSVGFNDVSYFSRIFKRHEGVTPSRYKRQVREHA